MTHESDEQFLLRYLWHHNVPCPRCSRDLHALDYAACPHCAEPLRIGVGMAQPHLRAWLALATPVIASAGVGLMLSILMLVKELPDAGMYPMMRLATVYFCLAIPLAAATLFFRRKIMRSPQAVQIIAAIAAWIALTAALILMFVRR